jgi:hypothetical protein
VGVAEPVVVERDLDEVEVRGPAGEDDTVYGSVLLYTNKTVDS